MSIRQFFLVGRTATFVVILLAAVSTAITIGNVASDRSGSLAPIASSEPAAFAGLDVAGRSEF